ncbi:hypothetical protein DWV13_11590 [Clostridium botulinum]|uniref:hypothetical protein n=1 Tax=Clostridium TaxID=1485 RepID=UPI0013FC6642|nr:MULTISPECIES: hypothetical protein [Clostridium]MCS6132263.1 hypothetical protein [Clostridium botulinum]NFL45669.1 hypothetical protein [Clostridium botulinum]NFL90566.1 hypothetical protein [Clostridium botulinum]
MKKKLIAGLLVAMSIITFAPTSVFATDEKQSSGNTALDEFLKKHKTEDSDFKLNFDGTESNFKPDATTQPVQANLQEGWNVEGDNPDKICKVINGEKVKGWYNGAVSWYYFNEADGTMARSKWINTGSSWYYVGADGHMLRETFVDGHWINVDGLAVASGDKAMGIGVISANGNKEETITVYDSSTGKSTRIAEDDAKVLSSQGKLGVRVERGSSQWSDHENDLKWFTK